MPADLGRILDDLGPDIAILVANGPPANYPWQRAAWGIATACRAAGWTFTDAVDLLCACRWFKNRCRNWSCEVTASGVVGRVFVQRVG